MISECLSLSIPEFREHTLCVKFLLLFVKHHGYMLIHIQTSINCNFTFQQCLRSCLQGMFAVKAMVDDITRVLYVIVLKV